MSPGTPETRRAQAFLIVAFAATALLYILATSSRLPPIAATRFDFGGEPNAFMTRNVYRVFMAFLVAVVPLILAFLPRMVASRWPLLLNIPDRHYWLADERRAATVASVESRTMLLAAVMIAFICFTHWLILKANAGPLLQLSEGVLFAGLGAFIAFVIGWIVAFYARFRR